MKNRIMFKGIITLALFLCISGLTFLLKSPASAFAGMEPKLNVKTKGIIKGKDYALKVYNLSETQTVTFSSDSPKIASVDSDGLVMATSVGTATITATVSDEAGTEPIKLQCKITVGPPAIFILLSRGDAQMVVGQRSLMYWLLSPLNTVEQPKFFSSSPEIASVSAGGIVTAKSEGTAYIFAHISNGMFDVCQVTVEAEGDILQEAAFEPDVTFSDFLIKLNENFTSGDNTSENTGASTAQ